MGDVAIRAEGLSKQFRIGTRQRYKTFRESLTGAMAAPFRRNGNGADREAHIWALKDVSFEVKRGEVVGIIGRNGAGKSTLLKILSRITEPTRGQAEIRGRVGSLLEVGTGFHPELTGRENVFLNGAILGMKKAEIRRKFEEIVAFAEVEKFIDTPVKFYSSGMAVRLAFAVAAYLEPEILLIDEVLAVGDVTFQTKCLKRIRELTRMGITSLFVSHNMHVIEMLSRQCLYLSSGKARLFGDARKGIEIYLRELQTKSEQTDAGCGQSAPDTPTTYQIESLSACTESGSAELNPGDDLVITLRYRLPEHDRNVHFNVSIWSEQNVIVSSADTRIAEVLHSELDTSGEIACRFVAPPLISGRYSVRGYILSDADWPLASFGWNDGRFAAFSVSPEVVATPGGMNWFTGQADWGVIKLSHHWQAQEQSRECRG